MNKCTNCGSYAINPHLHGRGGDRLDLCDVCYWRARFDALKAVAKAVAASWASIIAVEDDRHNKELIAALDALAALVGEEKG